jgi:peptidoglycan/xylan/chitin deacetylase (PgdA/CDA1 family)
MRATLTYHSIDDSGSPISVSAAAFDDHVRWLETGRVSVLAIDDLVRRDTTGDAVALTFDDGFANILAPVTRLRAAGFPVTVFVVTGHVGATNAWRDYPGGAVPTFPLLDWAQLEALAALGVTLGAHTCTHPPLTDLGDGQIDDELGGSQTELETRLGVRPTHVAYPYGDVDDRVTERARRLFDFAHTTEFAALGAAATPWRLPRLDMYYFQMRGALASWGSARFARRVGWIGARRLIRHGLLGGPHPGGSRRWVR